VRARFRVVIATMHTRVQSRCKLYTEFRLYSSRFSGSGLGTHSEGSCHGGALRAIARRAFSRVFAKLCRARACKACVSTHEPYVFTHKTCVLTHTHTHACVHSCVQIYIYPHALSLHIHIHTYTHTYINTYIYTYIHIHIHTYTHTYIYTYIHIHIHASMHACMHS
jgi:hypothetical protein